MQGSKYILTPASEKNKVKKSNIEDKNTDIKEKDEKEGILKGKEGNM